MLTKFVSNKALSLTFSYVFTPALRCVPTSTTLLTESQALNGLLATIWMCTKLSAGIIQDPFFFVERGLGRLCAEELEYFEKNCIAIVP